MPHEPIDPRKLGATQQPGWVTTDDGETVLVANYSREEWGWIRTVGWGGTETLLPMHRVDQVVAVETEAVTDDGMSKFRIADDQAMETALRSMPGDQ